MADRRLRLGAGRRIYAIGDIHGRLDLVRAMKAQIEADLSDAPCADAAVVFLGDYVDRGADSRGVVDFLVGEPIDRCERVCLKGNHEAMLLDFLDDPAAGWHWWINGAAETLASYGVIAAEEPRDLAVMDRLRRRFAEAMPGQHRSFLMSLPAYYEAGDFLFVHAGIRPGVALWAQSEQDLLWIREPFYADPRPFGRFVIHGHTPVEQPLILPQRADIDTGAWFSGCLSCLVVEDGRMRLLQVGIGG